MHRFDRSMKANRLNFLTKYHLWWQQQGEVSEGMINDCLNAGWIILETSQVEAPSPPELKLCNSGWVLGLMWPSTKSRALSSEA